MLKILECVVNLLPREMPQKFVVGLRKNKFVYCARCSYEGVEEDLNEEAIAHRTIAREAGFNLNSDRKDVLGGGLCRLDEIPGRVILSGSSGAYGSVPFAILQQISPHLFKAYQSVVPSMKALGLKNNDDLVKSNVWDIMKELGAGE